MGDRLRVLLVARDLRGYGGVNNVANSLAAHMDALGGVEFHLLSAGINEGSSWAREHLAMSQPSGLPIIDTLEAPLRARGYIRRAIEKVKPDLVHVHTPALVPPKGVPSLVTVHGTYHRDVPNLLKYPVSLPYKALLSALIYSQYRFERSALKYYGHFHAVSSMTAAEIRDMGAPASSISMVPNGVDTGEFSPGEPSGELFEKYGLDPASRIILSVGTITPRKGAHILVKAAPAVLKACEDAAFVLVGSCPRLGKSYLRGMAADARQAGISDRIKFIGPVPRGDLIGIYRACSVFAAGSFSEGCSLNILEAASLGKPVVSTDVGGARDVLGEFGLYCPPGNAEAMAANIVKALGPGKRALPGLRRRIEEKFSWPIIARDMLRVYVSASEK